MSASFFLARVLSIVLVVTLGACAYPTRNQEARRIGETHGYRWGNLAPSGLEDTLVIVTASGGGTRATALALSVLRGLDQVALPNGRTLAQEVDVISSVSGGSVTAAYFALKGRDGFNALEHDFIRKDGTGALLFAALNPVGLARLATYGTERIDFLIEYLDRQLFKGASYQVLLDIRDNEKRPFLLLNAADMVEAVPFSFTQRKFDLLCSDLAELPLATAVAASAAVPVAFSPVTLTNYQPCAAIAGQHWPPAWVEANLDDPAEPFAEPSLWYDNPQRATLGRAEFAYAQGRSAPDGGQKRYIHLLDGGIADNLGVFEPYRMLTTRDTQPSFLAEIDSGRITKLIFVVINARSFAGSDLDQSPATPGIADMLMASINAPIDRTTAGTANQLRQILLDEFRQLALADPTRAVRFHKLAQDTALISIDFDAIADRTCRRKFQGISTSWTLKPDQIDAVLRVGGALLANDPAFADLLRITGASQPGLPSLEETCAKLQF
jgi:NTE family protein